MLGLVSLVLPHMQPGRCVYSVLLRPSLCLSIESLLLENFHQNTTTLSEGLLCQVGSFPLLIYTLISISRARRTGPDSRPQVLVLYRTAITDGGERLNENFKTLIALSLENINGEKMKKSEGRRRLGYSLKREKKCRGFHINRVI